MDSLQLIRKQSEQDSKIAEVTDEVTSARTDSDNVQHNTLKERMDNTDKKIKDIIPIIYSDVEPLNAVNGTIWINPTIAIP